MEEPVQEGKDLKFNGSYMIAKAASKDELLQVLKDDIYTRSGVWDLDKVQILPVSAIPSFLSVYVSVLKKMMPDEVQIKVAIPK